MTALKKGIIFIALVISGFFLYQRQTQGMTIVYPDNCVFTIDDAFARAKKIEIKSFIDSAYKKNKNPRNLLISLESHFPDIKSVIIDMQKSESLHFTIQAHQPIFLLNNAQVICQHGKSFDMHVFNQKHLKKLENISFDGAPTFKNIDRIIRFFESLKDPVLHDFSIRWVSKHAIWLDSKNEEDLSLLVSYEYPPTSSDVQECRKLRAEIKDKPCKDKRGKPCKRNMTWVCDLRFDQQIVLFSTNKGG